MKKALFLLLFVVLSFPTYAAEVYNGWVKESGTFSADNVEFRILPNEDIKTLVLTSKVGIVSVPNSTCQYLKKYRICMGGYRFSLGSETRISGQDTEEFLIRIDTTYEEAHLKLTTTADKKELYVGEIIHIQRKLENEGQSPAMDVSYVETFPEEAVVNSKLLWIENNKLIWQKAIAPENRQDFFYDLSFEKKGSYIIPVEVVYTSAGKKITFKEDLAFNVIDEYEVKFDGKNESEIYEPSKLTVFFIGTPRKSLYVNISVPEEIINTNTTFEKYFDEVYWTGNLSGTKNFSLEFYGAKEGVKKICADVYYKRTNVHEPYCFEANISNKKLDVELIFKNETEHEKNLKILVKNRNNFAPINDIEIKIYSDVYNKVFNVAKLSPRESSVLSSDNIKIDDSYLHKFYVYVKYKINESKFSSDFQMNVSKRTETILPPVTPEINQTPKEPLAQHPAEPAVVPEPPKEEKKDSKNIIQRFFEWLGSIFK